MSLCQRKGRTRVPIYGFTLVELLVVVAVIGILIALLLPAVQAAREAARRTQCTNNIKQIVLAGQNHSDIHNHFPSGGWGWDWTGDPDLGFGQNQPGGWAFSSLPYLEQWQLYQLSSGLSGNAKLVAVAQTASTRVAVYYCPTRRGGNRQMNAYGGQFIAYNAAPASSLARTDYAANCGDSGTDEIDGGPTNSPAAISAFLAAGPPALYGISFRLSEVQSRDVFDGLSNTYYVGEKYLNAQHYENGTDPSDNEDVFTGYDNDLFRTATVTIPPMFDTWGVTNTFAFGSAHPSTFNMGFCDGSVHRISYDIDTLIHQRLANRLDGSSIDMSTISP